MNGKNAKKLRKMAEIMAYDNPRMQRRIYKGLKKNFSKLPKENRSANLSKAIDFLMDDNSKLTPSEIGKALVDLTK